MDGGDAYQWWSIPSDDRISLDLAPGGQPSTQSGDVCTHRLCSTHHSTHVHDSTRYRHLLSQYSSLSNLTLTTPISSRQSFSTRHHFTHFVISLLGSSDGFRLGVNPQPQFLAAREEHCQPNTGTDGASVKIIQGVTVDGGVTGAQICGGSKEDELPSDANITYVLFISFYRNRIFRYNNNVFVIIIETHSDEYILRF